MSERLGSVVIEGVSPKVDGGRYPAKRIAGERVRIEADIYKEGHDVLAAVVRWRQEIPTTDQSPWAEVPMQPAGNDHWFAEFPLARAGRYVFTVEAWTDWYASWADELRRKVAAGQRVPSELLEGAALLRTTAERAETVSLADQDRLLAAEGALLAGPEEEAVRVALDPGLLTLASRHPDRITAVTHPPLQLLVERPRAQTGAWYELFPRSARRDGKHHGTFRDAEALLPEVRAMGFDVLYLPPIHPIGRTARKGKNNNPVAEPGEVGSPWAIGASEGGHKAIHPDLGTLADFRRFQDKAFDHGLELALDLAFQCSPDHPYVKDHPEWFNRRPDGTIKTAENPPKKYQDIVNFDWLGPARDALWVELESVVQYWIDQGVKIFRVDNPHTKPVIFWEWLLRRIHDRHPDVVFLSEAFTRPKMMKMLAKVGFSQSYTYFTWRNFKHELEDYLKELTASEVAEYMRGNLWPNTPDILPEPLQNAPPAAFKIRLALAATLSSSYGIYSGYEQCEGVPLPGKEEYLDSEKFQLKARDPDAAGNIRAFISRINAVRAASPSLALYRNLRFWKCSNDRVLFYSKLTPDQRDQLLCVVSLDPYGAQEAILEIPLEALGIAPSQTYQVHDLLREDRALWQGPTALVQLSPERPAAIFRVTRYRKTEHEFDYFD